MAGYYLKDGVTRVPGATTISGMLDKPFLVKWANKLGKQGIDVTEYTATAAKQGTLIHSICESHFTKTEVDLSKYSDEEIVRAENSFFKLLPFEKDHTIETQFCEKAFVSEEHKFCGIVDAYCIIDGKYTVVDFKTSKSISKEQILQVSSYIPLMRENGYQVDQLLILCMSKEDNIPFAYKFVSEEESRPYFEIFKRLLDVYWIKKELGWE